MTMATIYHHWSRLKLFVLKIGFWIVLRLFRKRFPGVSPPWPRG